MDPDQRLRFALGGVFLAACSVLPASAVAGDAAHQPFRSAASSQATAAAPRAAPGPWPTTPVVTKEFDPPQPDWLPGHRGIDLAARSGQQVVSPRGGIVTFAGTVAGTPVVVVSHGSGRATYQPVVGSLEVGTVVAAGQQIGVVAEGAGHCANACVHWGLKVDETYLDPRILLGGGRVVLMPLAG